MRRHQRLQSVSRRSETRLERLRSLRLTFGLIGFGALFGAGLWRDQPALVMVAGAGLLAFAVAVRATRRTQRFLRRLRDLSAFYERQARRKAGLKPNLAPYAPSDLSADEKIMADDLNLFGPHSVFSLLDECFSQSGKARLQSWILNPRPNLATIRQRQECIRELQTWRSQLLRLRLLGGSTTDEVATRRLSSELEQSFLGPRFGFYHRLQWAAWAVVWGGVGASFLGSLPVSPWIWLFGYFLFSLQTRSQVAHVFSRAQDFALQLRAVIPVLAFIEIHFDHPPFHRLLPAVFRDRPSRRLRHIDALVAFLSTQAHPLVHLVVSLLVPWEFIGGVLLERWRLTLRQGFRGYVDEVAELEALSCLVFLKCDQTGVFPEFSAEPTLEIEDALHPLLPRDKAVSNSFGFPPGQRLGLLTGSNMSGKSTFLRTVAVNQVLALMGAPVFARRFRTFAAPVISCLRVTDSLENGYSTFYYEVRRIRNLLERARSGESFLFVVDEIFRGTNNRERLIGSRTVAQELVKAPGIRGFISTHDLELTHLSERFPEIGNWHFRDDVADGALVFSYRIHAGPCPTTNALKIMRAEGLPVELPD